MTVEIWILVLQRPELGPFEGFHGNTLFMAIGDETFAVDKKFPQPLSNLIPSFFFHGAASPSSANEALLITVYAFAPLS